MKIYYIDAGNNQGRLVATHADEQAVDASEYGENVKVFSQTSTDIPYIGEPPKFGGIDTRLIALPTEPVESLDDVKTKVKVTVIAKITAAESTVTSNYSPAEMLSWGTKDAAARAFLAGETLTDTQNTLLQAELAVSNVKDMKTLCESIVALADSFAKLCGTLSGLRSTTNAEIDAATTAGDVSAALHNLDNAIAGALKPAS